jgi:hypothetical protein
VLQKWNKGNELVHFVHTRISCVCGEIGINSLLGAVEEKAKILPDVGNK